MNESSKLAQGSSIIFDLRALFSLLRARRTKVFLYGFAVAFAAFTAYLAFCPAEKGSPWFNDIFSSASASTAAYRSQISSIVSSYIFPNSSSPRNPAPLSEVDGGGGSQGGGASESNLTRNGGGAGDQKSGVLVKKNETAAEGVKEDSGGSRDQKSGVLAKKNETAAEGVKEDSGGSRDQKSGVLAKKNETTAGGGAVEKGGILASNNHTSTGIEPQGSDVTKNKTTNGDPKKKDLAASTKPTAPATKNQTASGSQSKNTTASGVLPTKISDSRSENATRATDTSKKDSSSATPKNQTAKATASAKNGNSPIKNQAPNEVASQETQVPKSSKESAINPQNNASSVAKLDEKGKQVDWISSMKSCDLFQGKWVKDDSYPLYAEGSCPHIDEPFDCYHNGRPDQAYQKLRWQPTGCNIPRLNATDMLERLRGKRLVFVGDSLNRNMWESLVCVLRNSIKDRSKVFEASGRHEFRTEGSYSFVFKDFNCSVEFFRSPFLVQEWEMPISNGTKKETLRLDIIERSSSRYKDADVIVFNTGHWWTHEKTAKGKDYYQEGDHIYTELNVVEAFHKALNTWAKWVDANVNPKKSLVFFRGYSSSHFRGGQWNSGGQCDKETEPIKNEKYLSSYPSKMTVLESVIKGMKTHIGYLNITRMTDYRKDAHPSIYRKQNLTDEERRDPERFQDCSHWCLPGVPDNWNELLYAQLILKQQQQQQLL
ncbi:protein trichome birefringence-like [Zingiber officinale]|uniref:protein trichome birefringence-like n=1 Tax=Zingiber officinale TaxID=94328 RepID=UPI001C4AC6B7|nr:protein trichome birefringence-like [Zingiber officinale]